MHCSENYEKMYEIEYRRMNPIQWRNDVVAVYLV